MRFLDVRVRVGYCTFLVRGGSETRTYARRRRRYLRVRFVVIPLILFAVGAALFEYGGSSASSEGEDPDPTEQSQPESSSEREPSRDLDEAWDTATARDPSPSLATPGETVDFGRRIALTFDDGPDPVTTPAILDVLRAYNLKATFFVYGARAERHPEIIKRIVGEGHTLGNHTYYHRDMTKLPPALMVKELRDAQAAVDQALGNHSRMTLFRPPCGAPYNTETEALPLFQRVMQEQEMYPVMWNIDPRDWALEGRPDLIVDNVAQNTPADGGVILLHDTQPQTADALRGILDHYIAGGFGFTDARNLLAEKYGVNPEGIEADSGTLQPGMVQEPGDPGEDVPGDGSPLADCLT